MTQQPLFCTSYREALVAAISALGGNKIVGTMLWPSKEADVAADQLAKCLNPKKREKIGPEELAMIRRECRENNIHVLAAWEMQDANYAPPVPIDPETEQDALQREFVDAVDRLEAIQRKLGLNAARKRA
jgi:aromatic ring-cleaving dioxygenase